MADLHCFSNAIFTLRFKKSMANWIDVSQAIKPGMVFWPGQVPPAFVRISDMDKGDTANVTKLSLSVHTGTHMDAPLHFLNDGAGIDKMPLEAGIGKVRVMNYSGSGPIEAEDIWSYEKRSSGIGKGERIFFKTRNSEEDWLEQEFKTNYIGLSSGGADYLKEKKIQLVGIDYLSIAPYNDLPSPHYSLLGNGIWVVEGLNLQKINEKEYELICLPLKIENCDGSPCRVLMREL